jgi:hypothetical protein
MILGAKLSRRTGDFLVAWAIKRVDNLFRYPSQLKGRSVGMRVSGGNRR